MRFSRLKSPKPGAAQCVLCFTTASDCWTMFGSVTVPPFRRSCMTTPSDGWIRSGSHGTGTVRQSICARRAKSWDCFGRATFLRRKFLPMRGGGCSDALQKAQPRRGPPQLSRRLNSHPASGKNYEQKTCRNSSWGFGLALVRRISKTDAVEGDTAHGRSHYMRRLGI